MNENMKPSGISWIGDIPESWSVQRLKYLGVARNGLTYDPNDISDEGSIVLRSMNVQDGMLCLENIINVNMSIPQQLVLQKNDLLICSRNGSRDLIGKCALIDERAVGETYGAFMCVYRSIYNRFLYYVMQSPIFSFYLGTFLTSTINQLTNENLGNIKTAFTSSAYEQKLIADFLDEQCKKIDSIATDIEKQIEIFQKYKKSLITETVTKGLDKSVSMKDSGIEWIGDIPENWEVKRLKFLTVIKDGTHDTPDYVDEGDNTYPLITSKYIDYDRKTICFDEAKHISYDDFISIYKRSNVEKGDIIMPMIGTIGNPVIVETAEKFAIKNVALFKTCNDMVSAKFIYYQFYSDVLLEQFSLMKKGGVQSFVSLEILGNLFFIDTSHIVKRQLVKYLDVQCSKIDSIIESKKEQLTKITQHRKSLIYEYVTGKKRVKGAQSNGN